MMLIRVIHYTILSAKKQEKKELNMAICRVEKVKNYTVMSNYHLDDKRLSLKSIGLLSKMLRLPDDWDFSIKGLTAICHDGYDSIASALKELEKLHYIKREQERDNKGHVGKMIYYVYEVPYDIDRSELDKPEFTSGKGSKSPQRGNPVTVNPVTDNPDTKTPILENPVTDSPLTEEPIQEEPESENQDQISTYDLLTTQEKNTYEVNTNLQIPKQNNYFFSNINQSICDDDDENDSYYDEIDETSTAFIPMTREDRLIDVKRKVKYDFLKRENDELEDKLENDSITLEDFDEKFVNPSILDMIVDMMTDVYQCKENQVVIGNREMPRKILIERFERLTHLDIKKIIKIIFEKNPKNRQLYTAMTIMNF